MGDSSSTRTLRDEIEAIIASCLGPSHGAVRVLEHPRVARGLALIEAVDGWGDFTEEDLAGADNDIAAVIMGSYGVIRWLRSVGARVDPEPTPIACAYPRCTKEPGHELPHHLPEYPEPTTPYFDRPLAFDTSPLSPEPTTPTRYIYGQCIEHRHVECGQADCVCPCHLPAGVLSQTTNAYRPVDRCDKCGTTSLPGVSTGPAGLNLGGDVKEHDTPEDRQQ